MSSKAVVLLSLMGLLAASCAPKDEKLIRPVAPAKTEIQSVDDSLKLSFIAFDKQLESLHLVKAILNADHAKNHGLVVSTVRDTDVLGFKTQLIEARELRSETKDLIQVSVSSFTAETALNVNGTVKFIRILSSPVQQASATMTLKKDGKTLDIVEIETKSLRRRITLEQVGETFFLTTESVDEVITGNAKTGEIFNDFSKVNSTASFLWDGNEATLTDKIEISDMTLSHLKTALAKSEVLLKSKSGKLTLNLADKCLRMSGDLEMENMKPIKNSKAESYQFKLVDSSISIAGKKAAAAALECDSRPIVDIRKLQ